MLSLDGDDVVGRGRVSGHVDGEQFVLVGVGHLCAAGEMGDGLGLLGHGDGDGCRHLRGIGGTDVGVDSAVLLGCGSPLARLHGSGLAAIERGAVGAHPFAQMFESVERQGGQLSVGLRADVE